MYLVSVVASPWWITVLLAMVLIVFFRAYVVAVVGMLIYTITFAPPHTLCSMNSLLLLAVVMVSLGAFFIRTRLLE